LHVFKHVCMNQYHVLLFTNSGTTRKLLPLYIQIHTKHKLKKCFETVFSKYNHRNVTQK
jgi:hypothetical protein